MYFIFCPLATGDLLLEWEAVPKCCCFQQGSGLNADQTRSSTMSSQVSLWAATVFHDLFGSLNPIDFHSLASQLYFNVPSGLAGPGHRRGSGNTAAAHGETWEDIVAHVK